MKSVVAKTLDPLSSAFPQKQIFECSLVISDIDYTLLDFGQGHQAGIKAIAALLGAEFAREVNSLFELSIEGHRKSADQPWEKRKAFSHLLQQMRERQRSFFSRDGLKVWSREGWILMVAEKLKIQLNQDDVVKAREAYWNGVSEHSVFYPDASGFLNWLKENKKSLVLMTASDSVLNVNPDGSLLYDPEFSRTHKLRRLHRFFGETYPLLVGDPIDKPDPRFFEKVFEIAKRFGDFPLERILVVGDSDRNDLEIPRQFGCPTLLVKRH